MRLIFISLNILRIYMRFQVVQSKISQHHLLLLILDLISVSLSLEQGLQNPILLSFIISPSHIPIVPAVNRCNPFQTLTCVTQSRLSSQEEKKFRSDSKDSGDVTEIHI